MKKHMTIAISGALLSISLVANAADKAPEKAAAPTAAAPAAAKPADKAAAPAAAAPAATAAAAPAAPPVPTPAPELDATFKGYEGNWKCDTTFAAGSMGPGSPETKVKSEVKIKKESNGFWYKGEYKVKKSKTMPGMEGTFLLGYDAGLKAPVNVNYDGMGGYALETASGATADKIVFTGDGHMMGQKVKLRETMTKKGDKEVEHSFDVDMGKGFQPMGNDVCKK
jgi:autotransporter translocation and assembly factor TamB